MALASGMVALLKPDWRLCRTRIFMEDIQALHFKLNAYERTLKKHHLLDETTKLMDDWKKHAIVLPEIADDEELPFQERRLP